MRCKAMLLGGAMALAGAMVFSPGFAQMQTEPQSAPAAQAPADQSSPQTTAPGDQTSTNTVKHAVHHKHHIRTASKESRAERNTTKQLNEQQLAQAEGSANQQTAATTVQSGQGAQQMAQTPAPTEGQAATAGQTGSVGYASPNSALATSTTNAAGNPPGASAMQPSGDMSASTSTPSTSTTTATASDQSATKTTTDSASSEKVASNESTSATPSDAKASSGTTASDTQLASNTTPKSSESKATSSGSSIPMSQVQNAQQTLASAKVHGASGGTIGTVSQVSSDPNGAPTKVQVKLDQSLGMGERSVWINADQLQYQPQNNEVITNLTPEQLNTM